MAQGGGSHRGGSRGSAGRKPRGRPRKPGAKPVTSGGKGGTTKKRDAAPRRAPATQESAIEPESPPGPFTLGVIPGATPGKWVDAWKERMPRHPLVLVALGVADQRRALVEGEIDAAIVRLPIARGDLSVIALYDELPVVVTGAESHLTAADELTIADLAGEVVITPLDDVLGVSVPGAQEPRFAPPEKTEDAIATVASGVGVVIVPMSLARLHQRKDAASRPLRDGPTSTVAVAWVTERTTPLVDAFVGIVRGRTTNSSRG